MDLDFDVLMKNTILVHVDIKDNTVNVTYYEKTPLAPFQMENVNIKTVNDFFERRCFDINRPDKAFLLECLGLDYYNPFEIVKKTHGFLQDDFIWVRFEGEDLSWEDVRSEFTELSDR
jgi:hypothetical protein